LVAILYIGIAFCTAAWGRGGSKQKTIKEFQVKSSFAAEVLTVFPEEEGEKESVHTHRWEEGGVCTHTGGRKKECAHTQVGGRRVCTHTGGRKKECAHTQVGGRSVHTHRWEEGGECTHTGGRKKECVHTHRWEEEAEAHP
jgi:hypothetical protein